MENLAVNTSDLKPTFISTKENYQPKRENASEVKEKPLKTKIKADDDKKDSGITTKYYGKKLVRDMETGEVLELEYFDKRVKHTLKGGWRRVYLEQFMELLVGLYSSQRRIDLIEFILSNLDSENKLTMTQSQVIEKSKVSRPVVVDTYKYLIKQGFMKKVGSCFVVNPQYVCAFGSDKKNAKILISYRDEEPGLFDETN